MSRTTPAPEQHVAPSRLPQCAGCLLGREKEVALLDAAWADPATHVLTFVAWGGIGKTSLVAHWAAGLAARGYDGARYFDWSFYSQGVRDAAGASSDAFLAAALTFFGDETMAGSSAPAAEKGRRLAELIAGRRTLLILDGLEPLQHPPGSLAGKLKDFGVAALLKGLAQCNPGLCVVTTREGIPDLAPWHASTAPERPLDRLSAAAGTELLRFLGVHGADAEFAALVEDVDGHALTLTLMGSYLTRAHGGDVRRRDRVRFAEADAQNQGGHAFRAMGAYERWLDTGDRGWIRRLTEFFSPRERKKRLPQRRQLALLRLMGFFDRAADPGCLGALCAPPAIRGLTDPLIGMNEEEWNCLASDLAHAGLIRSAAWQPRRVKGYSEEEARWSLRGAPLGEPTEHAPAGASSGSGCPLDVALEAHPLVRECFAAQLREHRAGAHRKGHRRLYEHLKASVPYWPEGAEGLQPLYQAVAHGCCAGLHQDACDSVYSGRILRGTGSGGAYSTKQLGLIGSDLGAVACFFETPWSRPAATLSDADRSWLLNEAAFRLRALGRLAEALEPMRAGLTVAASQDDWLNAAIGASNLSELGLTLGDVPAAIEDARHSVAHADRSANPFERVADRTTLADALHQAGRIEEAAERFRESEALQAERQPEYPLLYSLPGFQYCDLLLSGPERAAWRPSAIAAAPVMPAAAARLLAACREVEERATQALQIVLRGSRNLLDIALNHLTLGRAALYRSVLSGASGGRDAAAVPETGSVSQVRPPHTPPILWGPGGAEPTADPANPDLAAARKHLDAAVAGLRAAGDQEFVARGLLARAWLRFLDGDAAGAHADLDEAWQIAEGGGMRLHMADILLTRARLFRDRTALADARTLIEECGYERRIGELEDAEEAAKAW